MKLESSDWLIFQRYYKILSVSEFFGEISRALDLGNQLSLVEVSSTSKNGNARNIRDNTI
jgi:hypothetical protein